MWQQGFQSSFTLLFGENVSWLTTGALPWPSDDLLLIYLLNHKMLPS